ncbi:MAG: hypothetical protein JWM74_3103 [Myxococcaceae bacterium]|nr:hypothetical protein [Myxococcaceae bacterium]
MKDFSLSRRGFLKGAAAAAGAAAGTRFAGRELIGSARAAGTNQPALLVIHLNGGFNSLFVSADSLVGKFGVTAGNFTKVGAGGAGPGIDNTWANSMSPFVKNHIATIGVRHGISSHDAARTADWTYQNRNSGLILANALGGTGSIKAAIVGAGTPLGPKPPEGGVTLQSINDMKTTIDALGGGAKNPRIPDREITAGAITDSEKMSAGRLKDSPVGLTSLREGYGATIDTLKQPVKPFSFPDLAAAYGLNANATNVNTFAAKMAAAELMITAGSNVVIAIDNGWDTHGDTNGNTVRNKMTSYVMPALNAFMNRMIVDDTLAANSALPGFNRNVAVCIFGDFARSLPGSDHQPNMSAAVMGKFVKSGTTGRTDANVGLAAGTPSTAGWWAYLAAITKAPGTPFGANPHNLVL